MFLLYPYFWKKEEGADSASRNRPPGRAVKSEGLHQLQPVKRLTRSRTRRYGSAILICIGHIGLSSCALRTDTRQGRSRLLCALNGTTELRFHLFISWVTPKIRSTDLWTNRAVFEEN